MDLGFDVGGEVRAVIRQFVIRVTFSNIERNNRSWSLEALGFASFSSLHLKAAMHHLIRLGPTSKPPLQGHCPIRLEKFPIKLLN